MSLRSLRTRTSKGGARVGRTTGWGSIPPTMSSPSPSSPTNKDQLAKTDSWRNSENSCSDYAKSPFWGEKWDTRILWASAELSCSWKVKVIKKMQSRHLKERQAGAAFWYLLRFHIGQQSDNIEHHLWFLSIPAFCQIIVDYSSLYHILVSNWKFHQTSTLYVPSSVFKPFSNNPTGLIRPKHWAPNPPPSSSKIST